MYETPQFMYILIAATLFAQYQNKQDYNTSRGTIMQFQHLKSTFLHCYGGCSTLFTVRFQLCTDVDDTLNSIFNSDSAIGYYVSQRAGIGINAGRIRGINAKIRGGEVQHTGVVSSKKFEATVRCCTQNGVKNWFSNYTLSYLHKEINDIIVLKNNKGSEDNRVRKLDYSIRYQNYSTRDF